MQATGSAAAPADFPATRRIYAARAASLGYDVSILTTSLLRLITAQIAGLKECRAMLEEEPTRIMVVDDHPVVRNGIVFSLSACPDLAVVAQAGSGEEALQLIGNVRPNVVLMDLRMPGMGGVAAIQAIREAHPETQVLALTSFPEGALVEAALQAGAIGYLLKDVAIEELVKAVRLAHRGLPVLAPAATQALVQAVARRPPSLGHDLTDRERQVLALLAEGRSNQSIADQLVITPATVKFHIRSIRNKLRTASRTETVLVALHHHLLPSQDALTPL
jgi:NarL family two-component system response regulator LiaR